MPATFGKRGRTAGPEPTARRVATTTVPLGLSSAGASAGPEFVKWARRLGVVFGIVGLGAFRLYFLAAQFQPGDHQIPGLIPQAEIPKTVEDGADHSSDLVTRYPGDPRAHFYRAVKFLHERDAVAAEQELRTALSERQMLTTTFSPKYEQGLHLMLALALLIQGRRDDANLEAQPVCSADIPEFENVLQTLRKAKICA